MTDEEQKELLQKQSVMYDIFELIDNAISSVEGRTGDIYDHNCNVEFDIENNEILISTRHKNPKLRLVGLKVNFYEN